ncbi:MAG: tetratricopeptide repeat protein [Betaproteobacteria bacterium]|nr:MAG: tetratricopeptide repeat protein [Betaproteobacteria bacterium]
MAAYDLEEQEQLATLKAWWKENGNLVVTALSLVLFVLAAWQGWNYYQRNQAAQASALYDSVQKAARAGDLKQVRESAGAILERYPRTAYASMAALVSAKAHFQSGDMKTAHAQLAWVAENAGDEGLQDIARLRLASVMLDEKAYDDALKALDAKHGAAFDALFLATRADVLVAQGKNEEAGAAYKSALERADARDAGLRGSIQLRLDALGAVK